MIKTLKGLQDVLGRHQDREVQVALLRSLGSEVGGSPAGEQGLMALGALLARLSEDEAAARGDFAARFAEFAAKEQRRLVKETFAP
jgi:CHAD domain-containing protein